MNVIEATIITGRAIATKLGGSDPMRAGTAGKLLLEALTNFSASVDREQLACKRGCISCCHQPVCITPPEAFFLARKAVVVKAMKRISHTNSRGSRSACPFLSGRSCSIYDARPSACRTFASKSAPACFSYFVEGTGEGVPHPDAWLGLRVIGDMAMAAALVKSGFSYHAYELEDALDCILRTPNAEEAWLSGVNIFDGLDVLPPVDSFHNDVISILQHL